MSKCVCPINYKGGIVESQIAVVPSLSAVLFSVVAVTHGQSMWLDDPGAPEADDPPSESSEGQ